MVVPSTAPTVWGILLLTLLNFCIGSATTILLFGDKIKWLDIFPTSFYKVLSQFEKPLTTTDQKLFE